MSNAKHDENHVPTALGQSSTDSTVTLPFLIDPITGRVLVDSSGTSISGLVLGTPTGTVNGTNLVFTVSNTPQVVIIDNMAYFGSGDGYTYAAGTITCNGDKAPISSIRYLY